MTREDVNSDTEFFRDGIDRGELLVRVCDACGKAAFPPMPGCPHCGHEHGTVRASLGTGTLYSWTVCHVAFDAAFAAEVPYTVGLVDVAEGARITARVDVDPNELRADLALVAHFPFDAQGQRQLTFIVDDEAGRS